MSTLVAFIVSAIIAAESTSTYRDVFPTLNQAAPINLRCPEGYTLLVGTQCFRAFPYSLSRNNADYVCINEGGGRLATPADHGLNLDIGDMVKSNGIDSSYYLGYTRDSINPDKLVTPIGTGYGVHVGHWAAQHPAGDGITCVIADTSSPSFDWSLAWCDIPRPFVCQRKGCTQDEFFCLDGGCVRSDYVCDGFDDCDDSSDELHSSCFIGCGGEQTSPGLLTSPNFPNPYPNNANCLWIIRVTDLSKVLQLQIVFINTEKSTDIVEVFDGGIPSIRRAKIKSISGNDGSSRFISTYPYMLVRFTSNGNIAGQDQNADRGFMATWQAVDGYTGLLSTSSTPQTLVSPDFCNARFVYTVQSDFDYTLITLKILTFDIAVDAKFNIKDDNGEIMGSYTAASPPAGFLTSGSNQITIEYFTGCQLNKGFTLEYFTGCSYDVLNTTTALINVPVSRRGCIAPCMWKICSLNGDSLTWQTDKGMLDYFDNEDDWRNGMNGIETESFIYSSSGCIYVRYEPRTTGVLAARVSISCPEYARTNFAPGAFTQLFGFGNDLNCAVGYTFNLFNDLAGTDTCAEHHDSTWTPARVMCEFGGTWSTPIPTCRAVHCGPAPIVENGFLIMVTSFEYLGKAEYGCLTGFTAGGGLYVCGHTGEWNPNENGVPVCTVMTCDEADDIEHGSYSVLQGAAASYGYIVEYSCDLGHVMTTESSIIVCTGSTGYSGSAPTCSSVWCRLPFWANATYTANITSTLSVPYKDEVIVTCNDGYILNNETTSYNSLCQENGELTAIDDCKNENECLRSPAPCQHLCMDTIGSFECSCDPGFKLGNDGFSCTEIDECMSNPCDGVQGVCTEGLNFYNCSCNDTMFELFSVNGSNGYHIPPEETGTRHGDVYQLNHTCVAKRCHVGDIHNLEHGDYILSGKEWYAIGEFIQYCCRYGYHYRGSLLCNRISCLSDTTWSTPTCQVTNCSTPLLPIPAIEFGQFYDHHCQGAGEVNTTRVLLCSYNSTFNMNQVIGGSTTCPLILCKTPVYPHMADTDIINAIVGTSFEFKCAPGYTPSGKSPHSSSSVSCGSGGLWEYGSLSCSEIPCSDPGTPYGGSQVSSTINLSYKPGAEILFECDDDDFTPVPPAIKCIGGSTTKWNDTTTPTCLNCSGINCSIAQSGLCLNESEDNSTNGCDCTDGSAADSNGSCVDNVDHCENHTCVNGVCRDLLDGFSCVCHDLYTGTECEMAINSSQCSFNSCVNNGTCSDTLLGSHQCSCPFGFTGTNCETDIDICAENAAGGVVMCLNGGECVDGLGADFTCNCSNANGYTGLYCHLPPTRCDDEDCSMHGQCYFDPVYTYGYTYCMCNEFYRLTGPGECSPISSNNCSPDPCQNSATCTSNVGGHECQCGSGYEGSLCQHETDECLSNPCTNGGTCSNLIDGYECSCHPGFNGTRCDVGIDLCDNCMNSANCTDYGTRYTCYCKAGFTGQDCQTQIAFCLSRPCQHGANCTDIINGYSCTCGNGWTGENCELLTDECGPPNPCQHGGNCTTYVGGFFCTCPAGFNGYLCETAVDSCAIGNPCVHGNCSVSPITGQAQCTCDNANQLGPSCNCMVNPCALNNSCNQRGICLLSPDGGSVCRCDLGYTGDRCEISTDECSDITCNSGNCVQMQGYAYCSCDAGFGGPSCHQEQNRDFDILLADTEASFTGQIKLPTDCSELTVGAWVKYAPFSRDANFISVLLAATGLSNASPLLELDNLGMTSILGNVSYIGNVDISTGNEWNYVAACVSSTALHLTVGTARSESLVSDIPRLSDKFIRIRFGPDFSGAVSLVQVWCRCLSMDEVRAITNAKGVSTSIADAGMILDWYSSDYQDDFVYLRAPSQRSDLCLRGESSDNGQCNELPSLDQCPGDQGHIEDEAAQSITVIFPEPASNGEDLVMSNHKSGDSFITGAHPTFFYATDSDGNRAECTFNIYVRLGVCEPPPRLLNGDLSCKNDGLFVSCEPSCMTGYDFVRPPPLLYTCGPLGVFNYVNPLKPLTIPPCGEKGDSPQYLSLKWRYTFASNQGAVQKAILVSILQQRMAGIAHQLCQPACADALINVVSSFLDTDVDITVRNVRKEVNVSSCNQLMATSDFMHYLFFTKEYFSLDSIQEGSIVGQVSIACDLQCTPPLSSNGVCCVKCPPGTYYNTTTAACTECPLHHYSSDSGQFNCTPCPFGHFTSYEGSDGLDTCLPRYARIVLRLCISGGLGKWNTSLYDPILRGSVMQRLSDVLEQWLTHEESLNGLYLGNLQATSLTPGTFATFQGIFSNITGNTVKLLNQALAADVASGNNLGQTLFTLCTNFSEFILNLEAQCALGEEYISSGKCVPCAMGYFQPPDFLYQCLPCPHNTTTATSGSYGELIDVCTGLCELQDSVYCLNGGTCYASQMDIYCVCPEMLYGPRCQFIPDQGVDHIAIAVAAPIALLVSCFWIAVCGRWLRRLHYEKRQRRPKRQIRRRWMIARPIRRRAPVPVPVPVPVYTSVPVHVPVPVPVKAIVGTPAVHFTNQRLTE